jgi:hypothetical protein
MRRLSSGLGMTAMGLLALASAATSQAGEPARTMAALEEKVQPGTQVDVVDRQGRILRGGFVRADDEGVLVTLHGSAEGRRVPAADIMTVTRAGDSLKNGALIGAAAGAITVLAIAIDDGSGQVDPWCIDTGCKVAASALAMAVYPAIGMMIDRAIKGHTVVYRAPADRVSWSVTPHPVPRGAGVRLALSF